MHKPANSTAEFWKAKIASYSGEAWAKHASPFANLVLPYLTPHSKVLELGTGAGQDGLAFHSQGHSVVATDQTGDRFESIRNQAGASSSTLDLRVVDISEPFPFSEKSFDLVYAHLVLHYFDDEVMLSIMSEIRRVLTSNGMLACMLNSENDPEFERAKLDRSGRLRSNGILKRYFTPESLAPFVEEFRPLLFNSEGRSPKDDAVQCSGMVQFIGRLTGQATTKS